MDFNKRLLPLIDILQRTEFSKRAFIQHPLKIVGNTNKATMLRKQNKKQFQSPNNNIITRKHNMKNNNIRRDFKRSGGT